MQSPQCASEQIIKNGSIHNGKPEYLCKACRYQFVEDPQDRRIPDETKALIDKLLLERISLAGIARVVGVSERWLQTYVNKKYRHVPREVRVRSKKRRLTIECDERFAHKDAVWPMCPRSPRCCVMVANIPWTRCADWTTCLTIFCIAVQENLLA